MEINTPNYNLISNNFTKTNDKSDCNPFNKPNNFGNYFDQCTTPSAHWGSYKPAPDTCDIKPNTGQPCTSIWNNLTKRKTVVDYDREKKQIFKPINTNPFLLL